MEDAYTIAQIISSTVTTLAVLAGVIFAIVKLQPERQALMVDAAESATTTMRTTMQELRVSMAQDRARVAEQSVIIADLKRDSIEKDIAHSKSLREHDMKIEVLKKELADEQSKRQKLERELAKMTERVAELTKQNAELRKTNEALRGRIRALESRDDSKEGDK